MKLDDLLSLDIHSNIPCSFCGKSLLVKEAYIEGTSNDKVFVLCSFCELFKDYDDIENIYNGTFEDVKEGYSEILKEMWIGLEPLPIDYI